jgi:hypothetical protein
MANAQQVEFLNAGMGSAYALGWVYTKEAGLLTDKAVYTAADKSASATNPFQLDSSGRSTVYAEGNYKFIIKDVNLANTITLDNLYYSLPASSDPVTSITATTYTILSTDRYVICNAVSGNIAITLLSASSMSGIEIKFVKTDASSYTVTVGSFAPLTAQNQALIIKSDGTNWRIVSRYDASAIGVLSKTDDYTMSAVDIGMTIVMTSAGNKTVTLCSLEAVHDGLELPFVKGGAGNFKIQTVDSDTIDDSSAGGYIENTTAGDVGATLTLKYIHSLTKLVVVGGKGTWTTA